MTSLFNYNTINTYLFSDTRTLRIELDSNFSFEMLFELESILSWCTNKPEINSVYFTAKNGIFPATFANDELQEMSVEKLQKFNTKLRKLVHAMFYLPQTIIMDLGNGTSDFGCELSIGADIRVGTVRMSLNWNHLRKGLVASAGGTGILPLIIGQAQSRKWLLSNQNIYAQELLQSGYLTQTYQVESENKKLLREINLQSPVSRIQTKRALLESMRAQLDHGKEIDENITSGALICLDYQKWDEENSQNIQFVKTTEFSQFLQEQQQN